MTFVVTTTRTDEWIEVHPAWVKFDKNNSLTYPPIEVPLLVCDSLGNLSSFVNKNNQWLTTDQTSWPDDIQYWALCEIRTPLDD